MPISRLPTHHRSNCGAVQVVNWRCIDFETAFGLAGGVSSPASALDSHRRPPLGLNGAAGGEDSADPGCIPSTGQRPGPSQHGAAARTKAGWSRRRFERAAAASNRAVVSRGNPRSMGTDRGLDRSRRLSSRPAPIRLGALVAKCHRSLENRPPIIEMSVPPHAHVVSWAKAPSRPV